MEGDECEIPAIKVLNANQHSIKGSMVFFYRSTSWIMRKIVNTVPDQTLQRIGKVIGNAKKAKSMIFESALENPIIFSIFLFWLLAAGLLVFLIGLNFLFRILFAKKGKEISAMSMFWATLSFLVCVVTSVIGMIIYSNSLDHIRTGIEALPQQLNTTTSDVSDFISNVNDTIMCIYTKQSGKLKDEVGFLFDSIGKNVNKFKDDLSMSHWKNVADLIGLFSRDIENMDLNSFGDVEKIPTSRMYKHLKLIRNFANHLSSLSSSVAEFRLDVRYTFSKIDNNLEAINNTKKEIFAEIAENMKTFREVLQFVNKEAVKLQRELADIFTEKRFSQRLHNILGYTLLIPFILVLFSLIGLIGISVSWTFYGRCDRYDNRKSRCGALSMVAASTLTTAGYTAMFLGALLCLMTAFCFLVACCAMFICMGFFENGDLRLFNAIPNLRYTANFGGQEVHYTLYETFYKCKNGYAFFDSLNGSDVMAAKQLRQGAVFRRHGISRIVRNFHVDRLFKQFISKAIQAFKETNEDLVDLLPQISNIRWVSNKDVWKLVTVAPLFLARIEDLIAELEKSEKMLEKFDDSDNRERLFSAIKRSEVMLQNRFLTAISTLFNAVVDISPQCKNLMVIWNHLGSYLCCWITAPAQALWLACIICSIGSSAIYHSFFNTGRFLQDFAESTQSEYYARRRRRLKYDYIRKKMKREEAEKTESQTSEEKPTNTKRWEKPGKSLKCSGSGTQSENSWSFSRTVRSNEAVSVEENQTRSSR